MDMYIFLKVLHIFSAMILFGTGLGTAFAMHTAHRVGDIRAIAIVARNVVLADWVFTTPSIIVQPITGLLLLVELDIPIDAPWVVATLGLFALAGICWMPVVWLQIQARNMAREAAVTNTPLPKRYFRYMNIWFALGWPAFIGVLLIVFLMVAKPG